MRKRQPWVRLQLEDLFSTLEEGWCAMTDWGGHGKRKGEVWTRSRIQKGSITGWDLKAEMGQRSVLKSVIQRTISHSEIRSKIGQKWGMDNNSDWLGVLEPVESHGASLAVLSVSESPESFWDNSKLNYITFLLRTLWWLPNVMGEILSYFYQKFSKALIGSKISTLKASESGVSEVLILQPNPYLWTSDTGKQVICPQCKDGWKWYRAPATDTPIHAIIERTSCQWP